MVTVRTPFTRRRVLAWSAGLASLFGAVELAARAGREPDATPAPTPTPAQRPPLLVLVPAGGRFARTNERLRGAVEQAVPIVHQALPGRPDVQVLEVGPARESSSQAYAVAPLLGSGVAPDMLAFTGEDDGPAVASAFAAAVSMKFVQPLDDQLRAKHALALGELLAPALEMCRHKDALLGVPLLATPALLCFDRVRFERANVGPPSGAWDWHRLAAVAQTLTRAQAHPVPAPNPAAGAEGGADELNEYGFWPEAGCGALVALVWQAGGDLVSADGTRSRLVEPPALEALTFYRDLFHSGSGPRVAPPPSTSEGISWGAEGLRYGGHWAVAMALQMAQDGVPAWWAALEAPPDWPIALAELPRGRRRVTPLVVSATLSIARTARDTPLAALAVAALAEQVTQALAMSARRQSAETLLRLEPRFAPAQAQMLAEAMANGRTPALGDLDRTWRVLNEMSGLAAMLRAGSFGTEEAARWTNAAVERVLAGSA